MTGSIVYPQTVPIYLSRNNVNTKYDFKDFAISLFFRILFEEVLADKNLDAVHLVTPIPLHAEQTIQVLEAGKHCACIVPMATSLEDIKRITEAVRKSGKNYMMMETTLYSYQFFYVKQMIESDELGKIQFMRGSHYQDMQHWQDYWMGLPPSNLCICSF